MRAASLLAGVITGLRPLTLSARLAAAKPAIVLSRISRAHHGQGGHDVEEEPAGRAPGVNPIRQYHQNLLN